MGPLINNEEGLIIDKVVGDNFIESLIKCTTFAVHCLYGLYVLHESVEVIHSDISPLNILYSPLDDIWKLSDFDQSMEIKKSLKTPRTAGTEGYISPESRETEIFTKASDVFALGKVKVIQNVLYLIILRQYIEYSGPNEKKYEKLFSIFERSMNQMCSNNFKDRFTVINALKHFYFILKNSGIEYSVDDLIISRVKNILDLEEKTKKDLENFEEGLITLELPKESEIKKPELAIMQHN